MEMEILRFAHQFFHFDQIAWRRVLADRDPDWKFAENLFQEKLLPRRSLKRFEPRGFSDARAYFEEIIAEEKSLGVRSVPPENPSYPEAIQRYLAPERRPPLIYLRGPDIPDETKLVSIVGTRGPSASGREAALSFSAYLGAIGVKVVSGLARGIDTIAHEESLQNGTIAILGAEVNQVYPEENQELAERIVAAGGTLASPFPPEQVPLPQNFPERNALIAALSTGVIVVEGAEKSGAAITGRHALAMGKTVVVLTQDFRSSFGRGAIRLQQDGAILVATEQEAVEAIFRRFGGFGGPLPLGLAPRGRRTFSFADFQAASRVGVGEALAALEEGIMQGRIERWGNKFRLIDND